MTYKLLAIDLDDTLLSEDLSISQANIDAIKSAESKGIKILLCSGRTYESMMPYVKMIDIHKSDDFIISYNGAFIHTIDGKEIFKRVIDGPKLERLIDIGRDNNITTQLYGSSFIIEKMTEKAVMYEYLTGIKAIIVEDLKEIKSSIKVLFNHKPGEELEALRQQIITEFGNEFNIFYSKPMYIEVLNKEASKGLAVIEVAKKLGIKTEEIVAMGDGFNDLSMIEYAGLGVAVKNAPNLVKEAADYVTKNDHNHNAVAEVIEMFF